MFYGGSPVSPPSYICVNLPTSNHATKLAPTKTGNAGVNFYVTTNLCRPAGHINFHQHLAEHLGSRKY